ncbi:hypothetical protein NDU88_010629 [Pleurodeles waltl]|uniref:Uncharacterized protein n=1 Tax=Pleurodeles waltl TaxID=8319 RepID=A0AAV7Q0P7_PLEWA|nr:hypothetical protein NDU88_010629 [Pleurodeles waltl]
MDLLPHEGDKQASSQSTKETMGDGQQNATNSAENFQQVIFLLRKLAPYNPVAPDTVNSRKAKNRCLTTAREQEEVHGGEIQSGALAAAAPKSKTRRTRADQGKQQVNLNKKIPRLCFK